MPRPTEQVDRSETDSDSWSDEMSAIMDGSPLSENSRGLKKYEVKQLKNEKDDFEEELLEAGQDYLSRFDVDANIEDANLRVVEDTTDIEHIDKDIRMDENAAYIHDEEEVLVFTQPKGMSYTGFDPVGTVAHELKHREQHLSHETGLSEAYPESEVSTQLLNFYRKGILGKPKTVEERINSLRDSDYPDSDILAEKTRLAAECYHNLRQNNVSPEESMEFILNEYEERRWNLD